MELTLKNEHCAVTVTDAGAMLRSLVRDGREYLWQGDPAYWAGQAPVCFPIVGVLPKGASTAFGKPCRMKRHGVARINPFTLTEHHCNGATFTQVADDNTLAAYPFDYRLEIRYELVDSTVADVDVEKLNAQRRQNMSFENRPGAAVQSCPVPNAENDLAYRTVDPHPFVPAADAQRRERCKEIFLLQASGLAGRLEHVGSKGCVLGISGGLDSTLALLVAVRAMELLGKPASAVLGVTMPGFGTTDRTYRNALDLMEALGVTRREISIADACVQHMADIGHDPSVHDIIYENTQARERTQILFDLANKEGCLLVGTGDLSELAMGWCTYNGDHMSMYGVNASVPKTLVRYLVDYVAGELGGRTEEILRDVLDTPVSPELLPPDANGKIAQKTEEKIGPYELHDFFLYHFVRFGFDRKKLAVLAEKAFDGQYDRPTIDRWLTEFLRRFFISQFKRSCIPDSPKVGSVSLSPRGDWRMPSDAAMQAFLQPDERI